MNLEILNLEKAHNFNINDLNVNINNLNLNISIIILINFIIHYYLNSLIYKYHQYISFRLSYNYVSIFSYILILYYTFLEFNDTHSNLYHSSTVMERVFSSYNHIYLLSVIYISYEIYSTFISIYLKNWLIVAHHVGLVYILLNVLNYNAFTYYIFYCPGLSTISNIPLAINDIFKTNKVLINKYPKTYRFSQCLFNISFIYVRIYILTPVYILFLSDINEIIKIETSEDKKFFLINLYYLVILFILMQYYWFILILKKVKKKFQKIH